MPLGPTMRTREMSRLMNSVAKLTLVQRAVLLQHLQVRDEGDRAAAVVQQLHRALHQCQFGR